MSALSEHDKSILNSIFNPSLPLGEAVYDEDIPKQLKDDEDDNPETIEAKKIEIIAIQTAEKGNLDQAINLFTKAIDLAPNRPSGYNNRGQTYQLLNKTSDALNDINKAIEVSSGKGKSYCQAICQRGVIHRQQGHVDEARSDFEIAAKMGSGFAKSQLVELNPYAAMCNAMLHKVISELK